MISSRYHQFSRNPNFIESLNKSQYNVINELMELTDAEIVELFKQVNGELTLTYCPMSNARLIKILLSDNDLLNKLSGITLSFLIGIPEAVEAILNNNDLLKKVEHGSLAILAKKQGMKVWEKIKNAGIIFEDGNYLCWAAGDQKEIALDIINNNENIGRIVNERLNYNFYKFEEVALKLLENSEFMQLSSGSLLLEIAMIHESCAKIIYSKRGQIEQIRNLNNHSRNLLENKYTFWIKEERPFDSSQLSVLARNADDLRTAIADNPNILNIQGENGRTILHYFVSMGITYGSTTISRIYDVLQNAPYNLMIRDNNGDTPLHIVSSLIHDRVTSNCLFPLMLRLAREQHFDFSLTNNRGQTIQAILQAHIREEHNYRRHGRINPIFQELFSLSDNNADPLNQALALSFNFTQPPSQAEFTERNEVSVLAFIKMELEGEQGIFHGNLKVKPLEEQLRILNYLIEKLKSNINPNKELENIINELDELSVFTSLPETIKKISNKSRIDDSIINNLKLKVINLLTNLKEKLNKEIVAVNTTDNNVNSTSSISGTGQNALSTQNINEHDEIEITSNIPKEELSSDFVRDSYKDIFIKKYDEILLENSSVCLFGLFVRSRLDRNWSLDEIINHAKKANNRSREACIELGWMNVHGQIISPELATLLAKQQKTSLFSQHGCK